MKKLYTGATFFGCVLLIATSRPSVTNACTNSETNDAWPDLLRVAAMNRHCVALPRGPKKKPNYVFHRAHIRKKEGGDEGGERGR